MLAKSWPPSWSFNTITGLNQARSISRNIVPDRHADDRSNKTPRSAGRLDCDISLYTVYRNAREHGPSFHSANTTLADGTCARHTNMCYMLQPVAINPQDLFHGRFGSATFNLMDLSIQSTLRSCPAISEFRSATLRSSPLNPLP